jgi:hypothetical protein
MPRRRHASVRIGTGGLMRIILAALLAALWLPAAAMAGSPQLYVVRTDHWSEGDERGYSDFIATLGAADCRTVDQCLHSAGNPFRASDLPGTVFESDCSDLPYVLRFYYAWKRGLPFSYEDGIEPIGASADFRYSRNGNRVTSRKTVPGGVYTGPQVIAQIRDAVSSATYRIHPDLDAPLPPDHYSPVIDPKSIRPGTVLYDPNGHVAIVYRIDNKGRVYYFDAHPDYSLTHVFYDLRFTRAVPGAGAGFKNWRPQRLVGARTNDDGTLTGGHMEVARNSEIADFNTEQFYGTDMVPGGSVDWANAVFSVNGERMDYYDWVRARLGSGRLSFDPVEEVRDLVRSNCSDLRYREQAVDMALAAGIQRRPEPDRLPPNIYGTEGDWEIYSTPSRDARLKTAFKELRDTVERFVTMYMNRDPHLSYSGSDLAGDLTRTYAQETAACQVDYAKSDGARVGLTYEEARARLFAMSFDPYQCVERRWGAQDAAELSSCRDGDDKRAWYAAEQHLRNQIDRTYEARMDFTRDELAVSGPGKGVDAPPDTDVLAYLRTVQGVQPRFDSGIYGKSD